MKTVFNLITHLDVEDELIEVVDADTEVRLFEFWSGSYFSGDLKDDQVKAVETLELKGFHIDTDGNNIKLVCSVQN